MIPRYYCFANLSCVPAPNRYAETSRGDHQLNHQTSCGLRYARAEKGKRVGWIDIPTAAISNFGQIVQDRTVPCYMIPPYAHTVAALDDIRVHEQRISIYLTTYTNHQNIYHISLSTRLYHPTSPYLAFNFPPFPYTYLPLLALLLFLFLLFSLQRYPRDP